jgi:hypothetical protein
MSALNRMDSAQLDADLARLEEENAAMEAKLKLNQRPSFVAARPAGATEPASPASGAQHSDTPTHGNWLPSPLHVVLIFASLATSFVVSGIIGAPPPPPPPPPSWYDTITSYLS